MAKQTSFAHQKHVLKRFQSLLTSLESDFRDLVNKYENGVNSLYEEEGLMEEIYEDYTSSYLNPLKEFLNNVATKIREDDLPFIEKELDFISSH